MNSKRFFGTIATASVLSLGVYYCSRSTLKTLSVSPAPQHTPSPASQPSYSLDHRFRVDQLLYLADHNMDDMLSVQEQQTLAQRLEVTLQEGLQPIHFTIDRSKLQDALIAMKPVDFMTPTSTDSRQKLDAWRSTILGQSNAQKLTQTFELYGNDEQSRNSQRILELLEKMEKKK